MTTKEVELISGISKQLGELIEGVNNLAKTTANLADKVSALEKQVSAHDHLLENFAERQDVKNLGDMYRALAPRVDEHDTKIEALEKAPADAALAASKRIKGLLWTIAGTVGGAGAIALIVYIYQALQFAHATGLAK